MTKNDIEKIKKVLAEDMQKYVQTILQEYGTAIPKKRRDFLHGIEDYNSKIIVEKTGTISMFADEKAIYMPKGAYRIFKYMKLLPGYGINKKHKSYKEGEIFNENTYYDYIKHVFVKGMNVEEFYRDTVLHETMHFCGSDGGRAMREGLTELKTRELARKYNLRTSRCGYPKEVEIANKFQQIIGEDVVNQIAFADSNEKVYNILCENCGERLARSFFQIMDMMDDELNKKYADHSKYGGILGPIKKAKAYSKIDYSKVHEKIAEFEEQYSKLALKEEDPFISELRRDYGIYEINQTKENSYDKVHENTKDSVENKEKDILI